MLLEQTHQYILALSDEDLIEYCACADYEPDAIAFAKAEIARRNLVPQSLEFFDEISRWRVKEAVRERRIAPYLPLSCRVRVLTFITGMIPIHGVFKLIELSENFDKLGQKRRKRELWLFAFSGLATTVLIVMMAVR
ncbi:MAG TPA: hypothetical protein VG722_02900 [Tepidisphaeraceae bacterium]|nr:hypothetical protein [Tepidisphaeraceae bacterium]